MKITSRIRPSTAFAAKSLFVASSANVDRNSGRRKNRPMAKPMLMTIVIAIMPLPSSTSSPSAASDAERMSIRVPMTRVSYSRKIPRRNGILMSLRSAESAAGSGSDIVTISPDGGRTLIATVVRPRIITPSMSACPP